MAQNWPKLNAMKTNYLKSNWLAPILGVVVGAGGLMAATTYQDLERKLQTQETFTATLDRLYADERLCMALKSMHDGKADVAAQRLDRLLCEHVLRLDEELASADERTRSYIEDTFRRIAQMRPKPVAARITDSAWGISEDQTAAERVLSRVVGGTPLAQMQ